MTGELRIGIDVRALDTASGRRGVGAYVQGLIGGLAQEAPARAEILLFRNEDGSGGALPEGFTRVRLSRPRRAISAWDQLAWPLTLARRRVRVFHSPFYAVPRLRPGCRVVQTVHDLTPLKLPESVSSHNARIFRFNFRLARTADRIIVPSEATRADVVALLGYPRERVTVIPLAAGISPDDVAAADRDVESALSRLGMRSRRGRYLIHTGGHDAVKNLDGLLEAFAMLVRQGRDLDLVIAGDHGPGTAGLIQRAGRSGLLERLRLPGHLSRQDLIALYRGACALVYPSHNEGFGLPLLEAMACGLPSVVARTGSLPEVGGPACLLASPDDSREIASAVARILDDAELAARLGRLGEERAAAFTWRETARRTLQVYREVAA